MQADDIITLEREDRLEMELANWIYQSHMWKRVKEGGQTCEWCGLRVLSADKMIKVDADVCRNNPKIITIISESIKEMIEVQQAALRKRNPETKEGL